MNNPKIVGIGEIGLDYYWTKENIDKQKEVFEYQVSLAEKYNKPIVVHSRDSIQDTYNILKQYKLKGTIHCFSSSLVIFIIYYLKPIVLICHQSHIEARKIYHLMYIL